MKHNTSPDRPLTHEEMHWDRMSMFLMAMSVGVFIAALLLPGREQPSLPEVAGLMLADIGMVTTALMAGTTIFMPRSSSTAQMLRRKTRRAKWAIAALGMTFAGALVVVFGNILAG